MAALSETQGKRALHWVLKIGNLSKWGTRSPGLGPECAACQVKDAVDDLVIMPYSIEESMHFYEKVLGLRVLRHEEFAGGCEGKAESRVISCMSWSDAFAPSHGHIACRVMSAATCNGPYKVRE
jgi:hypothetical protein